MSLFYVMIPDSPESVSPFFTRYGRLCKRLDAAKRIASPRCGRVFETDGRAAKLLVDFWVEPKPEVKRTPAEYRQARANAALFGVTL